MESVREKKNRKNMVEVQVALEEGPSVKPKKSRTSIRRDPFVHAEQDFCGEGYLGIETQDVPSRRRKKEKLVEDAPEMTEESIVENSPKSKKHKKKREHEVDEVPEQNDLEEDNQARQMNRKHKNKNEVIAVENLDDLDEGTVDEIIDNNGLEVNVESQDMASKKRKKKKLVEDAPGMAEESIVENSPKSKKHKKKREHEVDEVPEQNDLEQDNQANKIHRKHKNKNEVKAVENLDEGTLDEIIHNGHKKKKKKKDKVDDTKDGSGKVKKWKKQNDSEEIGVLQYAVPEEEEIKARDKNYRRKKKNREIVDETENADHHKMKKKRDRNDSENLEEVLEEVKTKKKTKKKIEPEELEDLQSSVPEEDEEETRKEEKVAHFVNNGKRDKSDEVDEAEDENYEVKKQIKLNDTEEILQETVPEKKAGACEETITDQSSDCTSSNSSSAEESAEFKRLLGSLINKQRKILDCTLDEIDDLNPTVEGPSIIDEINRNIQKHAKVSRKFIEAYEFKKVAKNRGKLRKAVDPDQVLPKKLAENVLSRNQARTLAKLRIIVPWEPAPLHLIETAVIKSPTAEQLKQISEQKLAVKKGTFSAEEDEILMNNWRNFCRLHDIEEDPSVFLRLKHLDIKNLRPKHRLNFVRSLARNLDDRLLMSVYRRFKTICSHEKLNTGRFTKAEDEVILDYVSTHSNRSKLKFSQLALILNRDFRAVKSRVDILTKPKTALVFTDSKLKNFVKELMEVTETSDVQELKTKEITNEHWHELSDKLDFPVKTLKRTWQIVAYPRLFLPESCDLRTLKESLIQKIQDSGAKNYEDIDWEQLASGMDGCTPQLLRKMFKELLSYYVPQSFMERLTNALFYLQKAVVAKHKLRTGNRFDPLHV